MWASPALPSYCLSLVGVEIWEEIKGIDLYIHFLDPSLFKSILFNHVIFLFHLKCLSPDINLGSWWQGAQNLQPSWEQTPNTSPAPPCGCWAGPMEWGWILEEKLWYLAGELATYSLSGHVWVDHERPYKGSEWRNKNRFQVYAILEKKQNYGNNDKIIGCQEIWGKWIKTTVFISGEYTLNDIIMMDICYWTFVQTHRMSYTTYFIKVNPKMNWGGGGGKSLIFVLFPTLPNRKHSNQFSVPKYL